jgi:hypothetical protein
LGIVAYDSDVAPRAHRNVVGRFVPRRIAACTRC